MEYRTRGRNKVCLTGLLVANLCASSCLQPAVGQTVTGPTSQPAGKAPAPKKNGFLKSENVGKPPDLPHFPKFTGKYLRFRGGVGSYGLTKGGCWQLRYETAEKPDQVLDWYENSLKSFGYDISERKPMRLMAMLSEQGIAVLIMVVGAQPGYSPMYKTHFTIRYIQQPPK